MTGSDQSAFGASRGGPRRSTAFRTALSLGALAFAILPGPVAAFGLLPAYQSHARFLLFYAPFICLLTLAYLLYIRDSLARAMFANLLRPDPQPDDQGRVRLGETLGRTLSAAGRATVTILPAVLLIVSVYCIVRYTSRLNESVAAAGAMYAARVEPGEEVGVAADPAARRGKARAAARARAKERSVSPAPAQTADSLPAASDSTAVRAYVLRSSDINGIPVFRELTILYIGAFAAAAVALMLMALKEHAIEAMGLSEQELLLG